MGWRQKNIISRPRCRAGSTVFTREHRRTLLLSARTMTVNVHRVQQWSELQRDDRIAAECASHPLPRNKFSLFAWQAVAAMAALLHSCFDHQRMLMRRMQGRRSLLQIGPTSRTRDSVWFLFPCQ